MPSSFHELHLQDNIEDLTINIAFIGQAGDSLLSMTAANCHALGHTPIFCAQEKLAEQKISLTPNSFELNGARISAVMLRVNPLLSCSDGYTADDRRFCDAEILAILAALREVSGLCSINGRTAASWFANPGWEYDYQRFRRFNVRWTDFALRQESCDSWIPFMFGLGPRRNGLKVKAPLFPIAWKDELEVETKNVAFGHVIVDGVEPDQELDPDTSNAIRDAGIDVCQLHVDVDNHPVSLSLCPIFKNSMVVEKVAGMASAYFESSLTAGH